MDDARRRSAAAWGEVEQLLDSVLELRRDARAAAVESASAGRHELRAEVLSLLEHAQPAERFFRRLRTCVRAQVLALEPEPPTTADPAGELPTGALVGRYRIVAFVGAGGMGTVYRAHDDRLDRDIALKLLPVHLTTDAGARARFLAEARAAAALDHANVCTIYEVGETAQGDLFIAMAHYEGETLRTRLTRGPLPLENAIACARQLARGLAAAHGRGIVHQDVKPGNVMLLGDGTARLLDFGLARVGEYGLTPPRIAGGTIPYMSPEQLLSRAIDRRTDLWSLGIVLYEMLTGVRPFDGSRVVHAVLHDEPRPLPQVRPGTPESIQRIVERLLRKDPDARYADVAELLVDLEQVLPNGSAEPRPALPARSAARLPRWVVGAAVPALLLAALLPFAWTAERTAAPAAGVAPVEPELVLVADFANFTNDPLLGDVVSDALRVDLARSPTLHVAGAASIAAALERMLRDRDTRLDSEVAREVALREGIRVVVDGAVRPAGRAYVVSAAIVATATGEGIGGWRETAADSAGVFAAIDRLSASIREGLGHSRPSLRPVELLYPRTTASLAALRAYSEGNRTWFNRNFVRAAALYQEAVRLDTAFAAAHTMVAYAMGQIGGSRGRLLEAHASAYRFRKHLSPVEQHAADGNYYGHVLGDLPRAAEAFQAHVQAAAVAGDVVQYAPLANFLTLLGDLAGAEAVLRDFAADDAPIARPKTFFRSSAIIDQLVRVVYRRGELDRAAAAFRDIEARYPDNPRVDRVRFDLAAASGDYAAADSLVRRIPDDAVIGGRARLQALTAAVGGRLGAASALMREARQKLLSAGHVDAALEITLAIATLHLSRRQPEVAVAEVDGFLRSQPLEALHPLDRHYSALARFFADAGQPRRGRELLAKYEQETPAEFRGADRSSYLRARAAIRLAEGDAAGALQDLMQASRLYAGLDRFDDVLIRIHERPELARAYERAGQPDSAIAVYERYLATTSLNRLELDAFELPAALTRLAALYERRGQSAAAAEYYLRFAKLWSEADEELREPAETARQRASDLMHVSGP